MPHKTIPISQARANIFRLVEEAHEEHTPILITGKNHDAVLLSLEDWNAIQETLYLLSIPGMRDSIVEGLNAPVEECADEVEW